VLIIGSQFTGLFAARELKKKFNVTVVDCKEFFEYTPGVLRAYVKPSHLDALTFNLEPVLERTIGVKFIWGEVMELKADGEVGGGEEVPVLEKYALVKPIFQDAMERISFDYCICCNGCNFGVMHPKGESLWFPTVHKVGQEISDWPEIDERFIEGRRRHILKEFHKLKGLNDKAATILTVGAGFIGVEWVTELNHFFPKLKLTICDFLPICLGPLPRSAAEYCDGYMDMVGVKRFYNTKYSSDDKGFWEKVELPDGADETYNCLGVKASNYFMPPSTLSTAPGPAGWIGINMYLQVCEWEAGRGCTQTVWPADGSVFAVGDCNYGCVGTRWADALKRDRKGNPVQAKDENGKLLFQKDRDGNEVPLHEKLVLKDADGNDVLGKDKDGNPVPVYKQEWQGPMAPIPKISYPGEEQAMHACVNIKLLHKMKTRSSCCAPRRLKETWWPWGAGMFATSLGPHDACFVLAANENKYSGYMINWWIPAALQKEVIETTKINECKDGLIGVMIWHFVHHTPVNFWGRGPFIPY